MGVCCCKPHDNLGQDHNDGGELNSPERRRYGRKRAQKIGGTDSLVLEALTALRKLADK